MGRVTPLLDFDYRTVEPSRIYKFNPKYFLTMGELTIARSANARLTVTFSLSLSLSLSSVLIDLG